ncbi:MAG: GEVED domain-containing protein [Chitinophagales bacterium]
MKKRLPKTQKAGMLLAAMILAGGSAFAQYCIPVYTTGTTDGDYVSYVGLGDIMNTTDGAPDPFYTDYTDLTTDLVAGMSYSLTVTSGSYTGFNDIHAWIDFNADGDFSDPGEHIGSLLDVGAFITGDINFTVPADAALGNTVMRVRDIWNSPADPDPCGTYGWGETEDYGINVTEGGGGGTGTAYYIYSNVYGGDEPWFEVTNTTAMNQAFGPEDVAWHRDYFETVDVEAVFSEATCFVFLEGSDGFADELEAFLGTNITTIENWVENGGHLLLNAAPNEGDGMSFGFGGTELNYSYFTPDVTAADPAHPIFNGPFTPITTDYTGDYFGHAEVINEGITPVIVDATATDHVVLGEMEWGAGRAMFGGMTTNNFHLPLEEAANLRANILSYLGCVEPPAVCEMPSGLYADGITDNDAVLHWNEVAGADQYRVTLQNTATGLTRTKGFYTNMVDLTDKLEPLTTYAFRVRTVCYYDLATKSDPSEWYYFTTLGRIGTDASGSIALYPNPNNGVFHVTLRSLEGNSFTISVLDALGNQVSTQVVDVQDQNTNVQISLQDIAAGVYHVVVCNDANRFDYPVVINK